MKVRVPKPPVEEGFGDRSSRARGEGRRGDGPLHLLQSARQTDLARTSGAWAEDRERGRAGRPGVALFGLLDAERGRRCMTDEELLESLEHKLGQIRDATRGVAAGYHTGFYLWGEGGTSKSYTVEETLNEGGQPHKVSNSRLTGRGLCPRAGGRPTGWHASQRNPGLPS
jgi:hypothetical protein